MARKPTAIVSWQKREPSSAMKKKASSYPDTPAFREEREQLPEDLRAAFDSLVEMYRYSAFLHHSRPFVSYKVLADLIRDGWRPCASSLPLPREPRP